MQDITQNSLRLLTSTFPTITFKQCFSLTGGHLESLRSFNL